MRKLSDFIDFKKPSVSGSGSGNVRLSSRKINESASGKVSSLDLADKLNSMPSVPNPNLVVSDNPKIKRLADTVASLLDKNCGWNSYTHAFFKRIDNAKSVLILSGLDTDDAITITPIGSRDSSVIRYYRNYDIESDNQTADYTISAQNMGTVKMLGLVFDIINNPDAYTGGMYEGKRTVVGNSYAINEAAGIEDIPRIYNEVDGYDIYKKIDRYVNDYRDGKDPKRPGQLGASFCAKGIVNFGETLRELGDKFVPTEVVKALRLGTQSGLRYREILSDGTPVNKAGGVETYCAIVKFLCTDKRTGLGVTVTANETVDVTQPVTQQGNVNNFQQTYRGIDVSIVPYIYDYPGGFDDFIDECDAYFDDMDDLRFVTEELVKYCKMSRVQKLKNINIGTMAVFISGVGGIGKSETWETIKSDMHLIKNVDYAERDNSSCSARELYSFIYSNNGKVLVFDDTPNLFDSAFQVSFWKKALEAKGRFPTVTAPSGTAEGEKTKGNFYSRKDCMEGGIINYKKMYYKECPETFNKKVNARNQYNKGEKEKTRVKMVPDEMEIMSRFLLITNATEEDMERDLKGSWGAIRSRCEFVRIAPPVLVIWTKIKQKLEKVKATNDNSWVVPPEYVDDVIDVVEGELKNKRGKYLTWRTFVNGSLGLYISRGRDWRRLLIKQMNTSEKK